MRIWLSIGLFGLASCASSAVQPAMPLATRTATPINNTSQLIVDSPPPQADLPATHPVLTVVINADAAPAIGLTSKSKVDDVLDALQADGTNVKSFSADLQLTEDNLIFNSEVLRFGKIWFQTKPNGDATLHVLLDQKQVGKKQTPEKREYLLDDGWLIDRDCDLKKEARFQLAPAGEKMNLFQLDKGPFPLPIGQDKKDVLAEFTATLKAPDKEDPVNTVHMVLTPKPDSRWAKTFLLVEVWVDCKTNMPVRVGTQTKSEYKMTDLLNLKVNPPLNPKDLALPALDKGWTSTENPLPPPARPGQN